jgi:serine/threonine protein kinase
MSLDNGAKLGPYEILGPSGAGGMGEVYRARDGKLDRTVAVKVLSSQYSADPERLRRFGQEARAASALNHPNIVTIHDIGQHDGASYLAMELIEGRTLRDLLASAPLPLKKALASAAQAGSFSRAELGQAASNAGPLPQNPHPRSTRRWDKRKLSYSYVNESRGAGHISGGSPLLIMAAITTDPSPRIAIWGATLGTTPCVRRIRIAIHQPVPIPASGRGDLP